MPITVYISARQEVEGVAAVVADHGRQLEAGESPPAKLGGVYDGSNNDFVPLIEVGKAALAGQISVVNGTKVAVEVRGGIKRLAQGVVSQQREMRTKAFLHFQDGALIER